LALPDDSKKSCSPAANSARDEIRSIKPQIDPKYGYHKKNNYKSECTGYQADLGVQGLGRGNEEEGNQVPSGTRKDYDYHEALGDSGWPPKRSL
jgi:hypothetical protein